MSETEQEVLDRLVSAGELYIEIDGWGVVNSLPGATFGDLRLSMPFSMVFDRPEVPMPVYYFDMHLKTRSGFRLHSERMKTLYGGKPVMIAAGVHLEIIWDIAIREMDPKVVKALKPGARGLTSANIDRDTGEASLFGNRSLSTKDKELLAFMRKMEHFNRLDTAAQVAKAVALSGGAKKR